MNKKRFLRPFAVMFFLSTLFVCSLPATASQFLADMVQGERGKIVEGKIYVKDSLYRMEIKEDGQDIYVIVNLIEGKTRVVVPLERVYIEIDNDNPRSMMSNPFQSVKFVAKQYDSKSAGRETLNGYDCEKTLIYGEGQDLMTTWVPKKLGFPIKIVNHMSKDMFVELKNINENNVDDTLFQTPSGFKKMERMPIPVPEWSKDIAAAPVMQPPFEAELAIGQIIRIKPVLNFHIKIGFTNPSDRNSTYSSVAFKDGRPLRLPAGLNMPPKNGGGSKTHKENPSEADEIVIRAAAGQISIRAELIEAPEGIVLQKYDLKAMSGRDISVDYKKKSLLRLTDDSDKI